jgi:hypothetical protein
MAESELSLDYAALIEAVARFLDMNPDSETRSEAETEQLDEIVQDGYRRFLYPPAVEGLSEKYWGYEWSFLKPVTTLTTAADDAEQDLPDDFGRLVSAGFTCAEGSNAPLCSVLADVGEGFIRERRVMTSTTGRPKFAAIRTKAGTGTTGQRKEVLWHPTPDDAYVLAYQYEAYSGALTETNRYPLGGMKHSALLKLACLSIAEEQLNDMSTRHQKDAFARALVASIERDKREGAKLFGRISNGEFDENRMHGSRDYSLTVGGEEL